MSAQPCTRAQENFLRLFIANPRGLQPEQWPTPVIFRRWLRRPAFRKAFDELRAVHYFTTDLHVSSAASRAAALLGSQLNDAIPDASPDYRTLLQTIRLCNLRRRDEPQPPQKQKTFPTLNEDAFDDYCIARAKNALKLRRLRATAGLAFDFATDNPTSELLVNSDDDTAPR